MCHSRFNAYSSMQSKQNMKPTDIHVQQYRVIFVKLSNVTSLRGTDKTLR